MKKELLLEQANELRLRLENYINVNKTEIIDKMDDKKIYQHFSHINSEFTYYVKFKLKGAKNQKIRFEILVKRYNKQNLLLLLSSKYTYKSIGRYLNDLIECTNKIVNSINLPKMGPQTIF